MKLSAVAKAIGVPPSTLNKIMDSTHKHALSATTLAKLGEFRKALSQPPSDKGSVPSSGQLPHSVLQPPLSTPVARDIPVLGTAQCGEDGVWQLHADNVIDYAERPPRLAAARNVFAVYVVGDSMEPWADAGQIIYVNRDRPIAPRDFVLAEVMGEKPGDPPKCFVKRLVRRTNGHIELEQFNPRKTITLPADRTRLYRIYTPWELAWL